MLRPELPKPNGEKPWALSVMQPAGTSSRVLDVARNGLERRQVVPREVHALLADAGARRTPCRHECGSAAPTAEVEVRHGRLDRHRGTRVGRHRAGELPAAENGLRDAVPVAAQPLALAERQVGVGDHREDVPAVPVRAAAVQPQVAGVERLGETALGLAVGLRSVVDRLRLGVVDPPEQAAAAALAPGGVERVVDGVRRRREDVDGVPLRDRPLEAFAGRRSESRSRYGWLKS